MKKNQLTGIILILLIGISLFIRLHLLPSHLFFGPEQGHDFLVIQEIVNNHKLTLIGAKTDLSGVFHGPLYYYLSAIIFYFTEGDPFAVLAFFILLSALSVGAFYYLGLEVTANRNTALASSALYAVSFGLAVNSRWLSSQPLSIPLSVLYFYFICMGLKQKIWGFLGAGICFAFLGQVELINFAIFGCITIAISIRYRHTLLKVGMIPLVFIIFFTCIVSFSNFLLFDLRHNFLIFRAVLQVLSSDNLSLPIAKSFLDAFTMFFYQIAYTLGSLSKIFGAISAGILFCYLLFARKKNTLTDLLMFWIFIPPVVLAAFRHELLGQMFIGSLAGYVLGIGMVCAFIFTKQKVAGILVFSTLVIVNLQAFYYFFPENKNVFFQAPQPEMRYDHELEIIRKIYEYAQGKPFFIQTYTIPYFWQDAWIYLFGYIGKREFGYLPTEQSPLLYVIIQKDSSNPLFQKNWYDSTVSTWGKKNRTFTVGVFTIEELIVPTPK